MMKIRLWRDDLDGTFSFISYLVKVVFPTNHSLNFPEPIIPVFPGPDLACRAGVQWVSVPKHYSNNSLFQASRARAGQHSNCGVELSSIPAQSVACTLNPSLIQNSVLRNLYPVKFMSMTAKRISPGPNPLCPLSLSSTLITYNQ